MKRYLLFCFLDWITLWPMFIAIGDEWLHHSSTTQKLGLTVSIVIIKLVSYADGSTHP